jgi:hypothetical protein
MEAINYTPIDYSKWHFSGQGSNLVSLLMLKESLIWRKALPFQDKRDDLGHAETVTYFAVQLTDKLNGNRWITLPAAILHDTGWSQMSKPELELFYIPDWKLYEPQLRQRHQEKGVEVAQKILSEAKYNPELTKKICDIISEHDTRKGFLSLDDGIVRDADKLFRFILTDMKISVEKRKRSPEQYYETRLENIADLNFFYSDVSRAIARIELESTVNAFKKLKD